MTATAATRPLPRASGGATTLSRLRALGPGIFGIVAFLVAWEALIRVTNTPAFVVPAPSRIAVRLWEELPSYAYEFSYTLAAAAIGLVIGTTIGIVGAILMANWRVLEKSLFPLAVILKLVPFVAIAPLLRIWLGYELQPKIVLATLITFFPVLVNCIAGMRSVDPLALEFFRSVGASRWEILLRLRWTTTLPYLYAALKVNVNLALAGAIVGELFSSKNGIGKVINETALTLDIPAMFAAIMFLAITGVSLTLLMNWSERRVLFWHDSVRTTGGR
ncbi:MAG TPA: ABC transporter permease [Candidatus Limnocylindria bacterium]|nr:ABC transporter permease [Candidatus Limnocylindria bacterium]